MTTATDSTTPPGDVTIDRTVRLERAAPKRRLRLGTRIFLFAAVLLAVALAASTGFASWQANRQATREIRADLESVPQVWEGWVASQSQTRRTQIRSLAEEVGTKSLLGGGANSETYHDSATDFARGLGAATVFLFDARGALLARSDRAAGEEAGRDFSSVSWVRDPLASGDTSAAFILEVRRAQRLFLVAAAPVTHGEESERDLVGVVAATFPFDEATAASVGRLVDGELTLVANVAPRGEPRELKALVSTAALSEAAVVYDLAAVPGLADALLGRGAPFGPFDLESRQEPYIATALPVVSGSGEPLAALVVARSKAARLAVFRRIRNAILAVGGVILLLALPVSLALARRMSRPIEQLAAGAESVGRGSLDVELPPAGGDEVGRLAEAFAAMLREMREKKALEDLVATLRDATGERKPLAEPDSAAPRHGALFAHRYRILEVLGEGGMGSVYRVQDVELDDVVALKILASKTSEDRTRGEQLLRQEIKLARAITHPNVVRVHDLGEADGRGFLTMEFVTGTTLRQLLARSGGRLDLQPGLQIAKQICRGLQAVHDAGIVHGDLKPENIMVQPTGVVKLMDFGVARFAAAQGISRVAVGTPRYMSPEHARGAELDERSDLYSLGVVLFEAATGRAPFEADDGVELMRLQLYATPPNPRQLTPRLPEELALIIDRCLAKSRPDRPASAAELERALMRVHV
jgi:serine/threonine-protein kinase